MTKRTGAKRASHWCTDERRESLYIRDGYTCLCCGSDLSEADCDDITLDHIVCHSAGIESDGRPDNRNSNVVTMCNSCNSQRGDRPWRDYYPGGAQERVERHLALPVDLAFAKTVTTERRTARYARKLAKHATKAA